jgi:hypothetical protein
VFSTTEYLYTPTRARGWTTILSRHWSSVLDPQVLRKDRPWKAESSFTLFILKASANPQIGKVLANTKLFGNLQSEFPCICRSERLQHAGNACHELRKNAQAILATGKKNRDVELERCTVPQPWNAVLKPILCDPARIVFLDDRCTCTGTYYNCAKSKVLTSHTCSRDTRMIKLCLITISSAILTKLRLCCEAASSQPETPEGSVFGSCTSGSDLLPKHAIIFF